MSNNAAAALLAPLSIAAAGGLGVSARPYLIAVVVFGLATIVFGLARGFALAMAALIVVGAADAVSTIIRNTIRQLTTPDHIRGRMTSVNQIFFMGGPQLGELEAGLVASLFASAALGATVSVVSGGLLTVLVTIWVAARAPVVRRFDVDEVL